MKDNLRAHTQCIRKASGRVFDQSLPPVQRMPSNEALQKIFIFHLGCRHSGVYGAMPHVKYSKLSTDVTPMLQYKWAWSLGKSISAEISIRNCADTYTKPRTLSEGAFYIQIPYDHVSRSSETPGAKVMLTCWVVARTSTSRHLLEQHSKAWYGISIDDETVKLCADFYPRIQWGQKVVTLDREVEGGTSEAHL